MRHATACARWCGSRPGQRTAPWRAALPPGARQVGREWRFELPDGGPEPLLRALIDGGAGIETLSIERPGLHDAFVAIAGASAAAGMGKGVPA